MQCLIIYKAVQLDEIRECKMCVFAAFATTATKETKAGNPSDIKCQFA